MLAVHADALWSAGLFDEAHQEFSDALALAPDLSRGHHGLARALASQNKLDEALERSAGRAASSSPRDEEIHHTVGAIFERMRRYEQAAAAYSNYVNLLPNKDRSDKAAWSRSQIRFLRSFGEREPIAIDESAGRQPAHRRFPRRRRQGHRQGARQRRPPAGLRARHRLRADDDLAADGVERACVRPITYTLSAGVGEVGLRGLQLGRLDTLEIGTLKLSNVPVLIKAPALRGIPKRETESFSPLGARPVDDHRLRDAEADDRPQAAGGAAPTSRLPMRHHRLSMVRGLLNDKRPTYFVVDTGGEVISISTATAEELDHDDRRARSRCGSTARRAGIATRS